MNAPKCAAGDYLDCLVASPGAVSGTEAARAQPARADPPAPDAFTRLLHRLDPDPAARGAEAARGGSATAASWSSTTAPWTSPTPGGSGW